MPEIRANLLHGLGVALTLAATPAFAGAPTPSTDPLAPKIFHISRQAGGGDVIPIQGAYLSGSKAYLVSGNGAPAPLPIVNSVGDSWLAVQLPVQIPPAFSVYLQNSHGTSIVTPINAALPKHLDATRLVPGGAFRIFGSKLLVPGATPSVTVGGLAATVNIGASNANMLTVAAPTGLAPTAAATVLADNGAGAGPTPLPQPAQVDAGRGDPLGLGVGWGAGFTFAGNVIPVRAACNGSTDDTAVIQSGVAAAAKTGGIVQLPAGTCRITKTIGLASRVVLKGAGQTATTLRYEGNYPIYAYGYDLVGLQDLQLTNAGSVQEGLLWVKNTRSFIKRVGFNMGVSRQWFLTSNRDFVFDGNNIVQTGSYNSQNPYLFNDTKGLVFSNNHSTNSDGSPTFQFLRDAAFLGNRFTRDGKSQNQMNPIVAHHRFVADFSSRLTLMGNTFDVINGPIQNKNRNDGETILVEGGGGNRTENLGTVKAATSTTVTDNSNAINVDPFGLGSIPDNYALAIVAGKGAGQRRRIVSYANSTMTVDHPWDVVPDSTSVYSTFVWALRDTLLIGNTLTDNPRGIWLYQCSVENVQIIGNRISEGGGIFLRSYHNASQKMSTVLDDVLIEGNSISNRARRWLSYIALADVSSDPRPVATGLVNIEIRRNVLVANSPNISSSLEDYAGQEGYAAMLHIEPSGGKTDDTKPNILGTTFGYNICQSCSQAFQIGTGTYGTMLLGNTPSAVTPGSIIDRLLLGSQQGASKDTVRR